MQRFILFCGLWCVSLPLLAQSLVGTWQLMDGEYRDADGQMRDYQQQKFTGYKVINDSHFAFISQRDGEFWAAASGTYTLSDGVYVERLTMASFGAPGESAFTFQSRLEGDHWYTERHEDGERVEYEHWQRVQ